MKRNILLLVVLGLLSAGVFTASAQEQRRDGVGMDVVRAALAIVADETGLTSEEIVAQLQEGMTVADVIAANGGDVAAVQAEIIARLNERIDAAVAEGQVNAERADRLRENLPDAVERALSGEFADRRNENRGNRAPGVREVVAAAAEQTGLEPREILEAVRDGQTLAEVVTANGGDVDALVETGVATATDRINAALENGNLTQEQADELIAALPDLFTQALNGELDLAEFGENRRQERRDERRGERDAGRALLRIVADETGLNPRELGAALQGGESLADILAANGVDQAVIVDAMVAEASERLAQAVESERITQEQADALLEEVRERTTARINGE